MYFNHYIAEYDLSPKKTVSTIEKFIYPQEYLDDFNTKGIKNFQILKLIIDTESPTKGSYSVYNDKKNSIRVFLKDYLHVLKPSMNLLVFEVFLDNALENLKRDSHHELIHWVQFKLLAPRGYNVDKGISQDTGQAFDKAYQEDYYKAERELYPLVLNAFTELKKQINRINRKLTEKDIQIFTGEIFSGDLVTDINTSQVFSRLKKDSLKQWERAIKSFKSLLKQQTGILQTN